MWVGANSFLSLSNAFASPALGSDHDLCARVRMVQAQPCDRLHRLRAQRQRSWLYFGWDCVLVERKRIRPPHRGKLGSGARLGGSWQVGSLLTRQRSDWSVCPLLPLSSGRRHSISALARETVLNPGATIAPVTSSLNSLVRIRSEIDH